MTIASLPKRSPVSAVRQVARVPKFSSVSLAGAMEVPSHKPSIDYAGFLCATQAITRHAVDVEQALRRMVFNVLAWNRDDHSRQHSYLMDETAPTSVAESITLRSKVRGGHPPGGTSTPWRAVWGLRRALWGAWSTRCSLVLLIGPLMPIKQGLRFHAAQLLSGLRRLTACLAEMRRFERLLAGFLEYA
jgi:hypothetical protein